MIPSLFAAALTLAASPEQVALEVDPTPLLRHQDASAAEETAAYVREDGVGALKGVHDVGVTEEAAAPTIVVTLSWVDYEASIYRIDIETRRPGEKPQMLESIECPCIDSGVSEAVLERLPAALEQLDEPPPAEPEPGTTPRDEPEPSSDVSPTRPSEQPNHRRPPIGPVGITGMIVAAGGLGGLGFGISRVRRGDVLSSDPSDEEREIRHDFGPQGRAWVGVGVAGVAVGATMLAIDLAVLRHRPARVSVGPSVGPRLTGLRIQGRF